MEPITESGELEFGIVVGGQTHRVFVLRAAVLSDSYRAVEAVPLPEAIDGNAPVRIAYQMAIDDAQILCQVQQLGTLEVVPGPAALAAGLDPDDMALLRGAADRLKKKLRDSRKASATSVASSSPSSAPASA